MRHAFIPDYELQINSIMTRHFLLLILISTTILSCKTTKTDKDKERIDAVCDKIMESFCKGNHSESILLLKQNCNVISPTVIDSLDLNIKKQLTTLSPWYGKMLSFEFISEHKIKDYIAKRYYILKFERYYQKFDFTLYRGSSNWAITSINVNDELIELLF